MNKTIFILCLLLAMLPLADAQETCRYATISGRCEVTDAEKHPDGRPVLLKLDTHTGDAWILIRKHTFPYPFYWEKVSNKTTEHQKD